MCMPNDKSKFSREFPQTFYSLSTPKYFLFDLNDETPILSRVTPVEIGKFLENFLKLRNFEYKMLQYGSCRTCFMLSQG